MAAIEGLERRLEDALAEGVFRYTGAAIPLMRRLIAMDRDKGIAWNGAVVGAGDPSLPLVEDLAAQPATRHVHLFDLQRKTRDRLATALENDAEFDGAGGLLVQRSRGPSGPDVQLHAASLVGPRAASLDGVLETHAEPVRLIVFCYTGDTPVPLAGARLRIASDLPVLLLGAGGSSQVRPQDLESHLPAGAYRICDGLGAAIDHRSVPGAGALWAFPEPVADLAISLLPMAVSKGLADARATRRKL
ncbi:MAG: hypothetical protein AAGJ32_12560 [Pseudomonadota bacterium]